LLVLSFSPSFFLLSLLLLLGSLFSLLLDLLLLFGFSPSLFLLPLLLLLRSGLLSLLRGLLPGGLLLGLLLRC